MGQRLMTVIVDPSNETDLFCLQYVFLPRNYSANQANGIKAFRLSNQDPSSGSESY